MRAEYTFGILQNRFDQGRTARKAPDRSGPLKCQRDSKWYRFHRLFSLADSRSKIHTPFRITRAISAAVETAAVTAVKLYVFRSLFFSLSLFLAYSLPFSCWLISSRRLVEMVVFDRCITYRIVSCRIDASRVKRCEVLSLRLLLAEFVWT